jgi:type VI secretion system secreted protein Hcp
VAVECFLTIEGIEGESQDAKHKGAIEVLSWSWAESQGDVGGGGVAGKVQMQDLHFTARVSKASPQLMLACAGGEHLKRAQLSCRIAGKQQAEFLRVTLAEVLVRSFATSGSADDLLPLDQASLAYSTIEIEYQEQTPTGAPGAIVKGGWDLARNRKL